MHSHDLPVGLDVGGFLAVGVFIGNIVAIFGFAILEHAFRGFRCQAVSRGFARRMQQGLMGT